MKRAITFLIIAFLTLSFSPAFAKDNSSEAPPVQDVLWDILLIRPLGFMGTVLGVGTYVISLPVTVPLRKKDEAKEILITSPYNHYFRRPLGEF
jgi:hypothetical protein